MTAAWVLQDELAQALDRGELQVHYQPLLRASSLEIEGFEALLRWEHPRLGRVPPASFVPALESSGQILAVGRWVLHTAGRQLQAWQRQGLAVRRMAVNLSVRQLSDVQGLVHTITALGLPPGSLCLELTESLPLPDGGAAHDGLDRLRALGVQLSMDDFGTGHSTLLRLQQAPVDALKIDRGFVNGSQEAKGWAVCELCSGLAQRLGLELTAEGIETPEQFARMLALGVDWLQGYFISPALETGRATQLLRRASAQPMRVRCSGSSTDTLCGWSSTAAKAQRAGEGTFAQLQSATSGSNLEGTGQSLPHHQADDGC